MTDDIDRRAKHTAECANALMMTIGALMAAGESEIAVRQGEELGELHAKMAARAYALQNLAEQLASEMPDVRLRIDELVAAGPLPGDNI